MELLNDTLIEKKFFLKIGIMHDCYSENDSR